MDSLTAWIIAAIALFLGGAWATEKVKRGKAERERDAAEEAAVEAETDADVAEIEREHDDSRGRTGSSWFASWRRRYRGQ